MHTRQNQSTRPGTGSARPQGASRGQLSAASRLLLLSLLLCLVIPTSAIPLICRHKNPFISLLDKKGVTVYPLPLPAHDSVCSKDWKAAGTCCQAASVVKFQSDQEKAFDQTVLRVQGQFLEAAGILQRGMQNFLSLRKLAAGLDPTHPIIKDLDQFTYFVTHGLNHVGTYSVDDQKCVDLTHNMRRKSACIACAGDSSQYFEGGKARISIDVCKAAISGCANTWMKLLVLVQGLGVAERIVDAIKSYFPSEFSSVKMNLALPIKEWIDSRNLVSDLRNCMGHSLGNCNFEAAQGVCQNLINLHDKTFIESAIEVIGNDLAEFKVVDRAVALVLAKVQQSASNTQPKWAVGAGAHGARKLSTFSAHRGNFGDIQVVRTSRQQCSGCISFDLAGLIP